MKRQCKRRLRFETLEPKRLLASISATAGIPPEAWSAGEPGEHFAPSPPAISSVGVGGFQPLAVRSAERSVPMHSESGPFVANHHDPFLPDFSHPQATAGRSVLESSGDGEWANQLAAAGPDDVVVVRHRLVLNGVADVHSIVIRDGGTLRFDVDGDQSLRVVNLQVLSGGRLEIGTEATPHRGTAEVVFKDVPFDPAIDPAEYGNGLIAFGSVSMYGRRLEQTYATLDAELAAGDLVARVDGVVSDWAVGDRLLIPDSRQLFYTASVSAGLDRYESPILESIGDGGLTFAAPLTHAHSGARGADGELVFLPHVANLSRNVVLRSENPHGVRGHTMFIGRAEVDVRYVEFRDLGRTTNSPIDDTRFTEDGDVIHRGLNQSSRYPVHLHHLIGPVGGTSSSYQYTVLGNAVHSSVSNLKWGITIHGAHYGRVHQNVIYNFAGAGIVTENGSESHNEITENFVSRISGTRDRGKFSDGREGSGIWLKRPNNFVNGNVVTGVQKSAYAVYGGDNTEVDPIRVPAHQGADPHGGSYQLISPKNMHLLSFDDNVAYASHMGLEIWYLGFENYYDPSDEAVSQSSIRSFMSWHIHHSTVFGEQANNVAFSDLKAIGSKEVGSRYNSPVGFNILRAVNVSLQNSTIANYRFGIVSPSRVERRGRETPLDHVSPFVVRGGVLSNEVNVRVNTPSEDAIGAAAPRYLRIEGVLFEANPVFAGGSGRDIFMSYDDGRFTNIVQKDLIEVVRYNGLIGNDYRVFYFQQSPDFVVPKSNANSSGTGSSPVGAPVAGMTNDQLWREYGVAVAGEVAPGDSSSGFRLPLPRVSGLAFPLVGDNVKPRVLAISPDTGVKGDARTSANRLTFRGVASSGSTVAIHEGNTVWGTTVADDRGFWEFDLSSNPLADGEYLFSAHVPAESSRSESLAVVVDTSPPDPEDGEVSIPEDLRPGTQVAAVTVANGGPPDQLRYAIVEDDSGGAYSIDSKTGELSLANASLLDPDVQPTQLLTIRVTNVVGVSADALLTIHVTPRPPGFWVTQLSYQSLPSLAANEITFVTAEQVATIPDAWWFGQIPSGVRAELRPDQLNQLRVGKPGMLALLSEEQKLELTADQYHEVSFREFRHIPKQRISWLSASEFLSITDAHWLSVLDTDSRNAITDLQIQHLDVSRRGLIGTLSESQLASLTTDQLHSVGYTDFAFLLAFQVAQLRRDQLESIPDEYWFRQIRQEGRELLESMGIVWSSNRIRFTL